MPSDWSSDVCSRSEEHTSELQSHDNLVCRLLLEKKTEPTQEVRMFVRMRPPPQPLAASTAPPGARASRLAEAACHGLPAHEPRVGRLPDLPPAADRAVAHQAAGRPLHHA